MAQLLAHTVTLTHIIMIMLCFIDCYLDFNCYEINIRQQIWYPIEYLIPKEPSKYIYRLYKPIYNGDTTPLKLSNKVFLYLQIQIKLYKYLNDFIITTLTLFNDSSSSLSAFIIRNFVSKSELSKAYVNTCAHVCAYVCVRECIYSCNSLYKLALS